MLVKQLIFEADKASNEIRVRTTEEYDNLIATLDPWEALTAIMDLVLAFNSIRDGLKEWKE